MSHKTRVKICGCASEDDVRIAVDAGADAVGFIFAESPRKIDAVRAAEIAKAVPPLVTIVAVYANNSKESQIATRLRLPRSIAQFSGSESPRDCVTVPFQESYIKAFHIRNNTEYSATDFNELLEAYASAMPLFDTKVDGMYGGSGVPFGWSVLERYRGRPYIVSGGLTPENVGACVRLLRPYGVDVRSGVESNGKKDPQKVQAFLDAVRAADAST